MNKIISAFHKITFGLLFILICISVSAKNIYVSPHGNDAGSGTEKDPFKTVSQAWSNAVKLFKENQETKIIIWLDDGVFPIAEPLKLDNKDEVFKNITFEIKAIKGANPVISGGIELHGWVKNENGIWEVQLPEEIIQAENIRELFIDNKRAIRARFPNNEYLRVAKAGEDKRTNFYFNRNDFPLPEKLEGVELVLLHDWSISRIGIKEIDSKENKLTAVDSIGAKSPDFFTLDHWEPNPRYFLENAPEFIDEDYEWVYLPDEKKIRLKLPDDGNPNQLSTVIPVSEGLVQLQGKEDAPLKNIHFEGITFRHSKWVIPEMGYCGVQACHFDPRPANSGWNVVPAAIKAEWAENCTFNHCKFENLGGSGLWLGTGCKNCVIGNSVFTRYFRKRNYDWRRAGQASRWRKLVEKRAGTSGFWKHHRILYSLRMRQAILWRRWNLVWTYSGNHD